MLPIFQGNIFEAFVLEKSARRKRGEGAQCSGNKFVKHLINNFIVETGGNAVQFFLEQTFQAFLLKIRVLKIGEVLPNFREEISQTLDSDELVFNAGGHAAQFSGNKVFTHSILTLVRWKQVEMLPNFLRTKLQPFDFENLVFKTREMLPTLLGRYFPTFQFRQTSFQCRGKCCPISGKHFSSIWSNAGEMLAHFDSHTYVFKTGGNAAQFSGNKVLIPMLQKSCLQKIGSAIRFSHFCVQNRGKCCPIFWKL